MTWTTLTVDDLLSALTLREREDFAKTSATVAVPDRVVPVLADLVAEIRGYIVSHSPNTISADTSLIPPSFKARAVAIARWRLLTTIPGYQPGDARKMDYEKAESFFTLVAQGKIVPEAADDAIPTTVPTPTGVSVTMVAGRSRIATRATMAGL